MKRRSGFTILELLIVIGIILILMAMFFGGAKVVTAQMRERDTKSTLDICKTMFENYRQATKLSRYPSTLTGFGPTASPATTWYTGQEGAVGSVTPDALGISNGAAMPASPKILTDSIYVYATIEAIPQNQTIIANLPPNKKINLNISATTTVAIPLDGWGNPILFVPGGGLTNIWIDPSTNNTEVMTSTAVQPNGYTIAAGTTTSNQPFFVSAGPDGDLGNAHGWMTGNAVASSMTDDNLYSFQ